MRKLKETEVVGRSKMGNIPYNEAWFSGEKLLLTPKDIGPSGDKGPAAKFQSLRKYAAANYGGIKLRLDVRNAAGEKDPEGDCIGIQAMVGEE